jgi:hypothetical protein
MKKRILVLAAIFGASASFAQVTTLKSKKGFEILPEAGDYAIQFDASPILNFAVEAVKIGSSNGVTASHPGYLMNNVVVGKYFVDASTAYRAKLGVNYVTNNVGTLLGVSTGGTEYIQTAKNKTTNIIIGGGIEKRRGHNRLQGFYGAELLLQIGSPTTTTGLEYDADLKTAVDSMGAAPVRSLGVTKSSAFGVNVRGFVGVEYFVLPKISIGAEFGWGLGFSSSSAEVTTESLSGTTVTETVTTVAQNGGINIGTDIGAPSGALTATFHF